MPSKSEQVRVLVACEFSGIVRDAFARRGHDAWSCDLLPSEAPGQHYERDVRDVLASFYQWDLLIAHPPCTYLAVSGARWWKGREWAQCQALAFVRSLHDAPVLRIALENPIGKISTAIRKPDQIIQPWQFGHGEVKATCLWLKNLPKLTPTNIVEGRHARVHREPPGADRWKNRSRTLTGIAEAMAEQWGNLNQRESSMTTTTAPKKNWTQRYQTIADRLQEYSMELEDRASDLPDSPECDALFAVTRSIDEAMRILERTAKPILGMLDSAHDFSA